MKKSKSPKTQVNTGRKWLLDLCEEDILRLNKSIERAERGEFISHEDVKAKYIQYLR